MRWSWSGVEALLSGHLILKYTGSRLQRKKKDAKETARYKWMLVVTELFNIAVNQFDAKKSSRTVFVVTKLVVSEIQCTETITKQHM